MLGGSASSFFNVGNELLEGVVIWQYKMFAGFALSHEARRGIVVTSACLNTECKDVAQNAQRMIENGRCHLLAVALRTAAGTWVRDVGLKG